MAVWTLIGYALLTIGLALVVFAWFADQSRGRRRCRKCWYDMAAVGGLTCPECGKAHRHEGLLWKTRRRVSLAFVGALVAASCFAAWRVPAVQRDGWIAVTPTWLLIVLYEHLDDWGPTWQKALRDRMHSNAVGDWHRRMLVRKSLSVFADITASIADRLRAGQQARDAEYDGSGLYSMARQNLTAPATKDRLTPSTIDRDATHAAIKKGLGDADVRIRMTATGILCNQWRNAGSRSDRSALPEFFLSLLEQMTSTNRDESQIAAWTLLNALGLDVFSNCCPDYVSGSDWTPPPHEIKAWTNARHDPQRMHALVRADANHPDWRVAALAASVPSGLGLDRDTVRDAVSIAISHPDERVNHDGLCLAREEIDRIGLVLTVDQVLPFVDHKNSWIQSVALGLASKYRPIPSEVVTHYLMQLQIGSAEHVAELHRRTLEQFLADHALSEADAARVTTTLAEEVANKATEAASP